MKWLIVILVILHCSCTLVKARKTVTTLLLDGSGSYLKGGDGKGYFTMWNWKQIAGETIVIDNPNAPVTKVYLSGSGSCTLKMTVTDNLGQQKSDTISYRMNGK